MNVVMMSVPTFSWRRFKKTNLPGPLTGRCRSTPASQGPSPLGAGGAGRKDKGAGPPLAPGLTHQNIIFLQAQAPLQRRDTPCSRPCSRSCGYLEFFLSDPGGEPFLTSCLPAYLYLRAPTRPRSPAVKPFYLNRKKMTKSLINGAVFHTVLSLTGC